MPYDDIYRRQVSLLVRMLPFVAEEACFGLKGGTAINLFVRDMPRLSVDIDLTYLPVAPRDESLAAIDAAMKRIAETARSISPAEDVTEQPSREGAVTRLIARGATAFRSRSKSRPSCAVASTSLNCAPWRPASKTSSALRK